MLKRPLMAALAALCVVVLPARPHASRGAETGPRPFRLWAIGDAHVGTDIKRNRSSLAAAIEQSEQGDKAFAWDIALNVGNVLVMSDRNDLPVPVGRGKRGG